MLVSCEGTRLSEHRPVILLITASDYERKRLRCELSRTLPAVEVVTSAEEAARLCTSNGDNATLVIDHGLLAETASPQWRGLRERYPKVGAVVRSLIPREEGILRVDPFTILVHPDDGDGLHEALWLLQSAHGVPAI
jgi:hypothetical protein